MEWIEGVTLSNYLAKHGAFTVEQALRVMKGVIEYCAFAWDGARNELVHHDIKPDNILIEEDSNGVIHPRLIGFGAFFNPEERGAAFATQGFAPPEPFFSPNEEVATKTDDSFSIAATLFVMLSGQVVWNRAEGQRSGCFCKFPAFGIYQDWATGDLRYEEKWTDEHESLLFNAGAPEKAPYFKFKSYIEGPRSKGICLTEQELNGFRHDESGAAMVREQVRETLAGTYGKKLISEEVLKESVERAYRSMDKRVKACLAACLSVNPRKRPKSSRLKAALPIDERAYYYELRIMGVSNALGGKAFAESTFLDGVAAEMASRETSIVGALDDCSSGHCRKCLPVFDRLAREGSHSAIYNLAVMARDGLGGASEKCSDTDLIQMMGETAKLGSIVAQNFYGRALYAGEFTRCGNVRQIEQNRELGLYYIRESARDDKLGGQQGFLLARQWLAQNGFAGGEDDERA